MKAAKEQLEEIKRGVVELHVEQELLEKLEAAKKTGKPLRVKAGFDPTAPDLHLGHTVLMSKLRAFQDLGHHAIFLIGDFTARIGDPTGKKQTRPLLSEEEIKANAETYLAQAMKILDPSRLEIRYNSEWMGKMDASDVIRLAAKFNVARMLEREDFKKRYTAGVPIAVHELLYPLVQGYDSVALQADVELGGTDQLFNLMVGRTLQKAYEQPSQIVITTPLLEGTDGKWVEGVLVGEKMSKSLGNYIGINEDPKDIYGKLMSISDALMWRYYDLLSQRTLQEIAEWKAQVQSKEIHPMDAKRALALEITARFSSREKAEEAAGHFQKTVVEKEIPEAIEEITLQTLEGKLALVAILKDGGMAPSAAEARRLIGQGAVTIGDEKAGDPKAFLEAGQYVIRVGKRQIKRFVLL